MPQRTHQSAVGPVKATTTAKGKKVKPAWTGMLKPPSSNVSPTKTALSHNFDTDDDDDDASYDGRLTGGGNTKFSRTASDPNLLMDSYNSRQSMTQKSLRNGFSLRESLNGNPNLNSVDVNRLFTNNPRRALQTQFGPVDPNIGSELENQIIQGSFVDFVQLALLLGHANNDMQAQELLRRDILIWCDCFSLYVSIIATVRPAMTASLMFYNRIILWIYRESQDTSAWWRYDRAFRRYASTVSDTDWSVVSQEIYAGSISVKYRETMKCIDCLSNQHAEKKCPFVISKGKRRSGGSVGGLDITTKSIDRSISPRRNERIEQALANPEKTAKRPNEGLNLKFAFG